MSTSHFDDDSTMKACIKGLWVSTVPSSRTPRLRRTYPPHLVLSCTTCITWGQIALQVSWQRQSWLISVKVSPTRCCTSSHGAWEIGTSLSRTETSPSSQASLYKALRALHREHDPSNARSAVQRGIRAEMLRLKAFSNERMPTSPRRSQVSYAFASWTPGYHHRFSGHLSRTTLQVQSCRNMWYWSRIWSKSTS